MALTIVLIRAGQMRLEIRPARAPGIECSTVEQPSESTIHENISAHLWHRQPIRSSIPDFNGRAHGSVNERIYSAIAKPKMTLLQVDFFGPTNRVSLG